MSLNLERLLWMLAAPLFAVVARKKKIVKKPAQKKVKPTRAPKKPARRAGRKPAAKPAARFKPTKHAPKDKRPHLKLPLPPVVAKPTPVVPIPKPVPPTGRAILLVPENDKFTDSMHPTFRWLSVGGSTRYEIAWSEDADFHKAHTVVSIATEATVPVEKPLQMGGAYHWHVRGGNESGWGPWSAVATFRVLTEAA